MKNTKIFYRKRLKLLTMILIVIIGAFVFTGCEKYSFWKKTEPTQEEQIVEETPNGKDEQRTDQNEPVPMPVQKNELPLDRN